MKIPVILAKNLLLILIVFLSIESSAYQVKDQTLPDLFDSAAQVSRVKIISSREVVVGAYDCGVEYVANVEKAFKGSDTRLKFRSSSQLTVGSEYLVFLNVENLDAYLNYLAMGKNDKSGYEACVGGNELYASGFHGEIFEFDSLWKTVTGNEAVKSFVDVSRLNIPNSKKVILTSRQLPDTYIDALSYWRIPWEGMEEKLLLLSEHK